MALAGFAAATSVCATQGTLAEQAAPVPQPNCWAEGIPPPGRIPSFYASLELRRASVNCSAGWGGSTCFQVAFPESVLEEWSWAGN